uniref:Uncharacterized protein n=1 Tax=Leersia perrieri TaxID=77586 RepID=A0A0D9VVD8_9ORYZ
MHSEHPSSPRGTNISIECELAGDSNLTHQLNASQEQWQRTTRAAFLPWLTCFSSSSSYWCLSVVSSDVK